MDDNERSELITIRRILTAIMLVVVAAGAWLVVDKSESNSRDKARSEVNQVNNP